MRSIAADLRLERRLVGRADAGEILDLAGARFFVETFHVALFGERQRCVDKDLDEIAVVQKLARERELRGEQLRLLREQGTGPVLERLHAYLLEIRDQLLPKSDAGQAVADREHLRQAMGDQDHRLPLLLQQS